MPVSEADWKTLRRLKPLVLERLCESILSECVGLASSRNGSAHERYLELFKLIRQRDEELGVAFDDMRRSTAIFSLIAMYRMGLLIPSEFSQFSSEARKSVLHALGQNE